MASSITYCSRCGKKFTDIRINVILHVDVDRVKENGTTEQIPNLDQTTREVLCEQCFDEYTNIMSQMNHSHS